MASLDEFCILYENDLGFPDFLGRIAQSDWDPSMMDISTPDKAAVNLLYLRGNISVREGIQEDICDVSVTFADGSDTRSRVVNQFDQGWLPQDFTYENGQNDRTAADLAQQLARAVKYQSGQFIYPLLRSEEQPDFLAGQQVLTGGWRWNYLISDDCLDFVLVPTSDGDYIVVFQLSGRGVDDYREAYLVETGSTDGRSVILDVRQVERGGNMTNSEIFRLYYDSGLAWPVVPEGADRFNDQPLDTLNTPDYAAAVAFSYMGGISAFAPISESGNEAVVRLHFADGSPSVDVQMQKTGDYWLSVGFSGQFDDGFGAYLVEDDSLVSYAELPVGATVAQAIENANGEIPLVQAGQVIKLEPAWGKILPVDGTLSDAVVRADGTLQYTEKKHRRAASALKFCRNDAALYTCIQRSISRLNT